MPGPGVFTSSTLPRHVVRGAAGFGLLAAAVLLLPVLGAGSVLPAVAGLVALRGCPLCWTLGLVQMLSAGRLRRTCSDGVCTVRRASGGPT
ncbi:hypothetical protein [Streptomyces sp. NPDC090022]|uniref:hypothetical protein n=1 Tax=Streptomyces sp. NPDC090022 TaxID=3365920 RepID=UPI00381CC845